MMKIQRADADLAFMLKFENVAWYENGKVKILDRRIYPIRTEYVICHSHQEVATAIADMVTQSEGPYTAAAMGMALAAYEARNMRAAELLKYMENAAYTLSRARPTTAEQMKGIVGGALEIVKDKVEAGIVGQELVDALSEYAINYINNNYIKYTKVGKNIAQLLPHGGTIMTQCFAGTVIGTMLRECNQLGNPLKVICAETRPYYQGARLTASVACDMGFDVTVISDNMPAYTMKKKKVDIFTSASDVITMDGHVVNKVGTFQIALAANYYGIPYYVTGTPDPNHKDMCSVTIEERNEELVLESLGQKITMDGVKGYYPAFDATPPKYCTGVVTDKGILKPTELYKYFEEV
ncbi:MAG: s-methyl-5-thioribose-1-phosphate isomerase [Velocimicrobium sp.]